MPEELTTVAVELPRGPIELRQPAESAELPDDGPVEWAPMAPYWSVLWRSGVALAEEVEEAGVEGKRIVELGCGLGVPSLAAARAGATVLATDADPEALELLEVNAAANGLGVETAVVDWAEAAPLTDRAPFDLVLASDVLYERETAELAMALIPRLAPRAWIADPGRRAAEAFLEEVKGQWPVRTTRRGIVRIHRVGEA